MEFKRINILHIDDEETYLEVIKILLEKHEFSNIKVDFTTDPEKLGEFLSNKRYDVIICDYIMPEMNGIMVLSNLRKLGFNTPFILLTGRLRSDNIMIKLNSFKSTRYFQKSLDYNVVNKLVVVINSLVDQ